MAVNLLMGPGDRSYNKVYTSAKKNEYVKRMYNRGTASISKFKLPM